MYNPRNYCTNRSVDFLAVTTPFFRNIEVALSIHFGPQEVVEVGEVGLVPLHQERHCLCRNVRQLGHCVNQVVRSDFNDEWLVVIYIHVSPLPAIEWCPFDVNPFLVIVVSPILLLS